MADFLTFHSKYSPLFHPTLPKFCQNHTEIKIISPLLFENFPYFTLVLPLFHQSFTLMICPLHPQFSPNYQIYVQIIPKLFFYPYFSHILPLLYLYLTHLKLPALYPHFTLYQLLFHLVRYFTHISPLFIVSQIISQFHPSPRQS